MERQINWLERRPDWRDFMRDDVLSEGLLVLHFLIDIIVFMYQKEGKKTKKYEIIAFPWFCRSSRKEPLVHQCTRSRAHQWFSPSILLHFPWSINKRCVKLPSIPYAISLTPNLIVHVHKCLQDLRLALGLAESVSQSTPIAAAANELYKVAKSHGLSEEDFSAVIEALKPKLQQ